MQIMIRRVVISLLWVVLTVIAVQAQESVQAKVLPTQLNVRQSPGTNAPILGQVLHGALVTVTGRQANSNPIWVSITAADGSLSGWVRSDYLQFPTGYDLNRLPVTASADVSAPADPPSAGVSVPSDALTGTTTTIVNFRAGPGRNFAVLTMLPPKTRLALTGRSADGTWLRGVTNGQEGWLASSYLQVNGDQNTLPVISSESAANAPAPAASSSVWGVPAGVVPTISPRARQIFLAGQKLGNRADVFSKVGDSVTARPQFLTVIGDGGLHLENYGYLQPVVDYFSRTAARTHNSFGNTSLAAHEGWTSADVLNPAKNDPKVCQPSEAPLVCEYHLTKPALALIMIGTNDAQWGVSAGDYGGNMAQIIQTSIDLGVIPVVSTLPDNINAGGRIGEFNNLIHGLAAQYNIPVWDYWLALQGLPNRGLDPDGIHPSQGTSETAVFTEHDVSSYGYTLRNLTALLVLDAVWKGALY